MICFRTAFILILGVVIGTTAKRHNVRRHVNGKWTDKHCEEPPSLKEDLATWMQISMSGQFDDTALEEWSTNGKEPEICEKSPKADGVTTIMERALCPWDSRVNYQESREPKLIAESVCLCRKSRGSTGAFCMPIVRKVPILRRVSCDRSTGLWNYVRSTELITVGCHSVLPRTQRAARLAHLSSSRIIV
ncbi:Interleukin-17 [Caenorhabditis elegans]|uniref:Interleukin-17 n=1 Tax=Caenorhabditis elegans TaxID=6239 RepID=G5EDD7_CAEEL|nr:Interleukin-17 [Caenorhabditis elegans]CAA98268.2 Interleukin-17 [Caenorhabditis elegans]|eukprot:NP_505700.2 Uncharacterized protein CELE_F25D1.3 [Caenorhabditis elegans]